MMQRQTALETWLRNKCELKDYQLMPLAGDASFRRYFRLVNQNQSYIVMDAPPERENCTPFVAVANALRSIDVKTPEVIAQDLSQGFLLLTDFGDKMYLKELKSNNAVPLYKNALDTLVRLQACKTVAGWTIPHFTVEFMRKEMELFKEWFLVKYLHLPDSETSMLDPFFDWLTETIGQQPYVFMHRDYHSANLMVLPHNQVGVLDFQDAFIGPVTYDLASLLRDCYIDWPEEWVTELATYYLSRLHENKYLLNVKRDEFLFGFDCVSMQRHLKALITFSRKYIRDRDANYLQHIPRTLNYLLQVSRRYPESAILSQFLKDKVIEKCVQ
jgi:aminoglycoside/choline kinase family phosphotransferase